MKEALRLQEQWENELLDLCRGRQHDDLTIAEQEEYKRISALYNRLIDEKLERLYPVLKESSK